MKKEKICPKCKERKEYSLFNKHSKTKDGLQCYCRKCENKNKNYRDKIKRENRKNSAREHRINLEGEVWMPINGYEEEYEVSNCGRIFSFKAHRLMVLQKRKDLGMDIGLRNKNKKRIVFRVHRLVAFAFIKNPENKPEVDHINNDRTNNCVYNLQWATRAEQTTWAYQRGRDRKYGESNKGAKLTNIQAIEIRQRHRDGERYSVLRKEYNISETGICNILNNTSYKI